MEVTLGWFYNPLLTGLPAAMLTHGQDPLPRQASGISTTNSTIHIQILLYGFSIKLIKNTLLFI